MKVSPSVLGPYPFSRQQRYLLVLAAGLLGIILVITALLTLNSFQPGGMSFSQPIWLGVLFMLALLLTGVVILLASSFRQSVAAEFSSTYYGLEAEMMDRKRAEETLWAQNEQLNATEKKLEAEIAERQNAQQFLDSVLENLPTMLFVKEAKDLRFVRWNKAGETIIGLSQSEMLGKNDRDLFPADEADFFISKDRETLESGEILDIPEEPIKTSTGDIRWLHTKKFRAMDAEGKPAYLIGISEDITERKRAEQEVRESEARYRDLFENANDLIQSVDQDGRMEYVNRAWKETLGYADAEIPRLTFLEILHPDERQKGLALLRRVTAGESLADIEIAFVTVDGRQVLIEGGMTPRYEGDRVVSARGIFRDVTERKSAEEQIRKQNAYMSALQETSLGLMQRLDVNALLQDIVTRAGALVGTENGYVFLQEPGGQEMELRVGVGAYEGFVGRRTKRGVGLAGQVWETNAPVVIDDYRVWDGRLTDASRDILRAVAGVPLISDNQVAGVIGLAYLDETLKFGEQEIQVLQRFAQLATIALDNARLYETAQQELGERSRAEGALETQLREAELLNRVTNHAVSLDVDRALMEICHDLADYFGVEQSGIGLLSEDGESLTIVADHSPKGAPSVVGYVVPVRGNPSTEIVLETRRPVAFLDAQSDPRLDAVHELMVRRGTASILIAPLFMRDQVIGTVGIDSYERHEFTDADLALVQRAALAIATALENARLYRSAQQELAERARAEQEIRQRNKELEAISRVSSVMTTNIDLIEGLETLARELVRTFRARNCGIALLNDEKTELTVVADALPEGHAEHSVGIVIPLSGNLSSQYVVENRRSIVIPDAQTDPLTEPIHERMRHRQTKCLAIVPLLSGGEVIGTIGLDTTDPTHIFSDAEIRLAETMANQMANAIEKQRLFDQTRERAYREQVTREIGANLSRSLDMETILQTMARELSHALGASHAVVRVGAADTKSNGGNGHTG